MSDIKNPLVSQVPTEVPLRNAPLVRVIAQVRFPLITAIAQQEFLVPFQEAVRADYPVLRQEQTQAILLGPNGAPQIQAQTAWRFSSSLGDWRASLAPEFFALETTAYVSRTDFVSRFEKLLAALGEHVTPAQVDRLGVRYIDRVTGPALADISKLVRVEIRGLAGSEASAHMLHGLTEAMFAEGSVRLLGRWGLLPAGATVDPTAVEPIPEASWILDLDTFSSESAPFDVGRIVSDTRAFAERAYTFFRWAVTDEFLKRYGAGQ